MLYGFLVICFIIVCFLLILLILVQKSKGGMGVGAFGGSSQMLFGGSGGQDVMQKTTWVLVAFFLLGSLVLSLMKSTSYRKSRFLKEQAAATMPHIPSNSQQTADSNI